MARDRVLIDLNSIAHAAHQGTVLRAGDQETQAVFGTLKTLRVYRVRYPAAQIIGLWDGDSWRKKIDAEYKANRQDDEKKRADRARFKSQMPYLRRALHTLGFLQIAAANLEADDLAAIFARRFTSQGSLVRLITGDQDWLQLVGPQCLWEDHRNETRKVNVKSFANYTGFKDPLQFVQGKALQGDTSDNLKGVGKIGEVGAADLIEVWGRVEAFLADPDPTATYKAKRPGAKKLPKPFADFHANVDGRQQKFFHNMHMMSLLGELPAPERLMLKSGEYSEERFKGICHELGFSSIYSREEAFETFVTPFKGSVH